MSDHVMGTGEHPSLVAEYIFHFHPVPIVMTALAVGAALVAINAVGTRLSAVVQNLIVIILLGPTTGPSPGPTAHPRAS